MKRSSWLHLRFPFSFFLLPVFLFALCVASSHHQSLWPTETEINWSGAISMFFILHFMLYPASNGYNSYFDKDKKSIGALRHPPEVSKELYYVSLVLDVLAIAWGLFISWKIAWMLLVYGLVSKAYSHPGIRLKKYPYLGWFIAGVFQGGFVVLMVLIAVDGNVSLPLNPNITLGALLATLLLWGSFPMTQVYQHDEDGARGDMTISRKLGVRGTFAFTLAVFLVANLAFVLYFVHYETLNLAWWFELAMLPIIGYFLYWYRQVWNHPAAANYTNTMRLNFISAVSLNLFFGLWLILL